MAASSSRLGALEVTALEVHQREFLARVGVRRVDAPAPLRSSARVVDALQLQQRRPQQAARVGVVRHLRQDRFEIVRGSFAAPVVQRVQTQLEARGEQVGLKLDGGVERLRRAGVIAQRVAREPQQVVRRRVATARATAAAIDLERPSKSPSARRARPACARTSAYAGFARRHAVELLGARARTPRRGTARCPGSSAPPRTPGLISSARRNDATASSASPGSRRAMPRRACRSA